MNKGSSLHPIVGKWKKMSFETCGRVYPEELEIFCNGLYTGKGAVPGQVPGWDHGTWEVTDDRRLAVSTDNDAVLHYAFLIQGDALFFVSPEGCSFTYRRIANGELH